MNRTAVLAGIGSHLPPRILTNEKLAARIGGSDEWIRTRTGVASHHVAAPEMATSELAIAAGERALRSAGTTAVDAALVATTTPDQPCPATAPIALDHAHREGRPRPADRILLTAFGVGLVWGSAVLT